jgi:glycine/D-amino acid oxidase-like deaminating enzyme
LVIAVVDHDTHIGRHNATGWWLEEAGGADPRPPLRESLDADVLVIGGGYSGMWTAWHLLEAEPGARVVLLEGNVCGFGPSGRNGGFCESLWFSAASVRERFGDAPARALLEAASRTVSDVGAWCEANDVDAWFNQSGYMCVSTGEAFDDVGLAAVEAAAALGFPEAVQDLSEEQVAERCASPVFGRGVFVPDFATVQPARLALGLRRRLIERGVQIFEHSRVRALRHEPGSGAGNGPGPARAVVAETDGGRVRAGAAVLAVGGAARSVAPLRSRLTVTSSHIVLTEPVPDVLEEVGWTGGECITDGRTLLHYFRTTRDGRILLGWGGGRLACGARLNGRVEVDGDVAAEVIGSLERIFPGVRGRRIAHAWGGPIDVSPSHLPQVGTLPGAPVHFALGFTGNGVGPTCLAARALAALALDRRDQYSRLPIVESGAGAWVPPEPLAFVGGSVVRAALLRVEKAAEKGERPDPLARALCAAPRLVGMHLGR